MTAKAQLAAEQIWKILVETFVPMLMPPPSRQSPIFLAAKAKFFELTAEFLDTIISRETP